MTEVKEKNENVVDLKEEQAKKEENKILIKVPIKHPVNIDGVLIKSVELDFSKITGEDVLEVDEQLRLEGTLFDSLYNQKVLLHLSARAANMKIEDLKKLHVGDYLEVTMSTRNFFFNW